MSDLPGMTIREAMLREVEIAYMDAQIEDDNDYSNWEAAIAKAIELGLAAQPGPREVVVPEWVTHISISKGYPGTDEEPWMANLTGVPEETPYYTFLRGFGDTPREAFAAALAQGDQ